MTSRDDDEAWAAIVENYGERAVLDGSAPVEARRDDEHRARDAGPTASPREPHEEPRATDFPGLAVPVGPPTGSPDAHRDEADDDDRFVPPPPPPLPTLTPARRAAWAAVLGVPLLLLLSALVGWRPGTFLALLAVAAFLGGFGYLVATMSREPRDPWDNGARV